MNNMEAQQKKIIYAILHDINMIDNIGEVIIAATNGDCRKFEELNHLGGNQVIKHLKEVQQAMIKPMRSKIIHYLCVAGFVKSDGTMDYGRQDVFIKSIGSKNPKQKALAWLGYKETLDVLNQVEMMLKKELNKTDK
jgi:hypothetical protein